MEENAMVEETTMTAVENMNDDGYYYDDGSESSATGKVLAAGLALGAGAAALTITGYKKLKTKMANKPKKKTKKRLRWVDVPIEDDEVIDSEAEVISEEESEE